MTPQPRSEREVPNRSSSEERTRDETFVGEPATDYQSKRVMLRAERGDPIRIRTVTSRFNPSVTIPDRLEVERRAATYYGPELLLVSDSNRFLLTAPGPMSQLFLWADTVDTDEVREGWTRIAEVQAELDGTGTRYSICPDCGEPIKTAEHDRLALLDRCPGFSD